MIQQGSIKKQLVVFYVGATLEPWDETNLLKGGIGGSETAVIWMARHLSRLGYLVKIFANIKEDHRDSSLDDVEYIHYRKWELFAVFNHIDFFISSRTLVPFHSFLSASYKYVWVHDKHLGSDKTIDCKEELVDAYLCLSDWHKEFFHQHHGISLNKIKITANGVEPSRYKDFPSITKKPQQIFYSSGPERGLATLLHLFEKIHTFVPNLRIVIAYGFNTLENILAKTYDPIGASQIEHLKKAMKRPYVKYLGRIDQQKRAQVQLESSGWFYPTHFDETFCITAVEAGFARVPILSSKRAGLISTVKDGGLLLEGDPLSKEYLESFSYEAIKLLTDTTYNNTWAEKAYSRMQAMTWDAVALQWHEMFQ